MADENKLKKSSEGVSYKETLNLPHTDFPIRPQAVIDDPAMIKRWEKEELFKKSFDHNQGKEKYIFHDGPPYANGNIHLGHAYNKTLKDIATKSQRMAGKHVPVTPGWDCHGLPIEIKVAEQFPDAHGSELIKECRSYAAGWIKIQKEQFKALGVLMDWDNPYTTMDGSYEAAIVRAFGEFVDKGYISRSNKTVPWCASCQTVLANAEIEYEDRKDPSIYVAFPLESATAKKVFPHIVDAINMLIWTTTPWTLPLNKMVILKPKARYDLIKINNELFVLGAALTEKMCAKLGVPVERIATCVAEDLIGGNALHPFIENQKSVIVAGDFVGTDEGTACVHGAPGCGADDYDIGIKNGVEIFSPLTSDGKYDVGILPEELVGQDVTTAHGWVIKTLSENDRLIKKESITHSYPHCWRCHKGLIFRATKQWFCDLSHNNLREKALEAVQKIKFVPERTRNRLKASLEGRLEWCLSRQRTWGVPIVAAVCNGCSAGFVTNEMIETLAKKIEKEGIECWNNLTLADIMPHNAACKSCGGRNFTKEKDILDVWFESGVSHYAVLKNNKKLGYPADLYLEGSDQHRAWFQSSLLTSVVLEEQACMKSIVTNGFTVDGKGRKMSKSLGNVVVPDELIQKMGTDGLRLWATSIDISSDAVVSDTLLNNVQEVFRKIRNTARFLVSNVNDFDVSKDAVAVPDMLMIDQAALQELAYFNEKMRKAYNDMDVTGIYHMLADYCTVNLSSYYLDIIKDRLYTDKANGLARRSAQTACFHILDTLTKLVAPVLSFTAEQLSDCYQKGKSSSIHLQDFNDVPFVWEKGNKKESQWEAMRALRSSVLKAIEKLRQDGQVKHSLEAKVTIAMNTSQEQAQKVVDLLHSVGARQTKEQFLREYFIVSACDITDYEDEEESDDEEFTEFSDCYIPHSGLLVKAGHADGIKCPRCWQWEVSDHEHGLCTRCQQVTTSA
ncbi:isoleucine--tRNA ligase [Candidatus Babeliales bacterium]|nr:isoleucine--tRNA ligase [Candidatus Babeliales bacterium]